MTEYRRYGVYYTPPAGAFADFGGSWLGWDAEKGVAAVQPTIEGLDLPQLTQEPRKYGFHATLKAPFRLAQGIMLPDLTKAFGKLASELPAVVLPRLQLAKLGSFFALVPKENIILLQSLADKLVTGLDHLRAPLTAAEVARRKPERLSARQRDYLDRWGYPYVFDEFRFHMTLSGPLDLSVSDRFEQALKRRLAVVPDPLVIDSICLMGEGEDGRFYLIERAGLKGSR